MKLDLPILVERQKREGGLPRFHVRPLFGLIPVAEHEDLNQALSRLGQRVLNFISMLKEKQDQQSLADFTFCPDVEGRTLNFTAHLRDRSIAVKLHFGMFKSLGGHVAFAPNLPQLWFTVQRGERLERRAEEIVTQHLRDLEKREDHIDIKSMSQGNQWISTLPLDIHFTLPKRAPKVSPFIFLGNNAPINGAEELNAVGRCLEFSYPDSLERAILREQEIEELQRLLEAPVPRPILLLGPSGTGKTAILHELIYRKVDTRRKHFADRGNTWLLSPQRLISGMSYVGQWENRVLAIFKESKAKRHTLYFDDFIGLYSAGTHSSSSLGVAHVLKPFVERGELRIVAEMTPEQHRVFQEIDRGFSDQFYILRIDEPSRNDAIRMLINTLRQEENRQRCRFAAEALPMILELTGRHMRQSSFPGKAAAFLQQAAAKYRGKEIGRAEVLAEFQARTGLALYFLDSRAKLERSEIAGRLAAAIVGQTGAVDAMARCVAVAKARLNDTSRPLGVFLFLGPTGVGKTQAAKALATSFFGNEDRMLRFDMNEYADIDAPARLTGTWSHPDGLLTGAISRQPFAVVLLDEIEKAHPSACDLLLQVLGEGRLTDSLGRTADFSHAIIIMTSNLGAREVVSRGGFRTGSGDVDAPSIAAIYRQAAERYFRPEFYNRIDAIVPFERLRRAEIERIAKGLIGEVFRREGFARRKCALSIHPDAMRQIVDRGYDPELGARAQKRTIERDIAQVLAGELCGWSRETPTLIQILPSAVDTPPSEHAIRLRIEGLVPAAEMPRATPTEDNDPQAEVQRLSGDTAELGKRLDRLQPKGSISLSEINPSERFYFAMRQQFRAIQERINRLKDRLTPRRTSPFHRSRSSNSKKKLGKLYQSPWSERPAVFAADDIELFMRDLFSDLDSNDATLDDQSADACRAELQLLAAMLARATPAHLGARALIGIRALEPKLNFRDVVAKQYSSTLGSWLGLSCEEIKAPSEFASLIVVSGPHAFDLLKKECGVHMEILSDGRMLPVCVEIMPLSPAENPFEKWNDHLVKIEAQTHASNAPTSSGLPIIRLYESSGTFDFHSGLISKGFPSPHDMRTFLLAALPDECEEEQETEARA